jgi:hypothetical protein
LRAEIAMNAASGQDDRSWFRSAAGLRFGAEIGLILAAKLALLALLYFAFVAPQPRADTSAAALRAHVLPAAGAAVKHDAGAP